MGAEAAPGEDRRVKAASAAHPGLSTQPAQPRPGPWAWGRSTACTGQTLALGCSATPMGWSLTAMALQLPHLTQPQSRGALPLTQPRPQAAQSQAGSESLQMLRREL